MGLIKRIYFDFFVLIYALYAFFNKGIAYSYLSEVLLAVGILILLADIRKLAFPFDKRMKLLLFFVGITFVYIVIGIRKYPVGEVIRDSVIFNYILITFIIYFFKDELPHLKKRMATLYKWYPLVVCIGFFLSSYIPFFRDLILFGDIHFFEYKFGDMGVHLFIATMLLLNGYIKISGRYMIAHLLLIAYLFLIVSSYSRSGMVSYVIGMVVFFIYSRNVELRKQMIQWLKYLPAFFIIALPLYLATNIKENFQGRSLSLDQLQQNVTSIFSTADNNSKLSDNKMWRLIWWAEIVDYTFLGEYFWTGRGLGMSLIPDDPTRYNATEGGLRSPHSFHLTILARFGVPIFFVWIYWMIMHLKKLRKKKLDPYLLMVLCISLAFLVNASFDVYLEGPMGALPFWTIIGLTYATEAFDAEKPSPA